jgi:hypothetical protein
VNKRGLLREQEWSFSAAIVWYVISQMRNMLFVVDLRKHCEFEPIILGATKSLSFGSITTGIIGQSEWPRSTFKSLEFENPIAL